MSHITLLWDKDYEYWKWGVYDYEFTVLESNVYILLVKWNFEDKKSNKYEERNKEAEAPSYKVLNFLSAMPLMLEKCLYYNQYFV